MSEAKDRKEKKPRIVLIKPQPPGREPLPIIPKGWDKINDPAIGIISKTYSYFDYYEVSSSLQKAIRRGWEVEAIQWAIEMAYTGPVALSNLWNRFLTMSIEDIGVADPMCFINVYHLYLSNRDDSTTIATVASYLAKCKKCRVVDWMRHFYPEIAVNKDQPRLILETLPKTPNVPLIYEGYKKFFIALKEKDITNSIYWATVLILSNTKITAKYKSPQYLIWIAFDNLLGFTPKEDKIDLKTSTNDNCSLTAEVDNKVIRYYQLIRELALKTEWRFKARSRLLVMHIIIMICFPKDLWPEKPSSDIKLDSSLDALVARFIKHDKSLMVGIFPDIALDMHTIRGRKLHRGFHHFMTVGSILENKHPDWAKLDNDYKEIICKKLGIELS